MTNNVRVSGQLEDCLSFRISSQAAETSPISSCSRVRSQSSVEVTVLQIQSRAELRREATADVEGVVGEGEAFQSSERF